MVDVSHVLLAGGTGRVHRAACRRRLSSACWHTRSIETIGALIVEWKALRDGSGGAGKYRGGLGRRRLQGSDAEPFVCSVLSIAFVIPPRASSAVSPAHRRGPRDGARPANPRRQIVPPAPRQVRLPGGGGYGLAGHRDPELVTARCPGGLHPRVIPACRLVRSPGNAFAVLHRMTGSVSRQKRQRPDRSGMLEAEKDAADLRHQPEADRCASMRTGAGCQCREEIRGGSVDHARPGSLTTSVMRWRARALDDELKRQPRSSRSAIVIVGRGGVR